MSDALPYRHGIRIPRLLGLKNYLHNYFTVYTRLTRFLIYAKLEAPTNLGLGIIFHINV